MTSTFASAPATSPAVLSAENIELGYVQAGGVRHVVLSDFSLQLQQGEIVALLGPSGVGKSSLLRVLGGLQTAGRGEVRVHGDRLKGPHPRLGFVFQDPTLLPWLNLEQNVAFGLDFKHQPGLSAAERQRRVGAAIEEVGLTSAIRRYPAELSGGMAQRTSLARCLAREPEILLLDEPFSALDEVTRAEMQALLLSVARRHNAAVVLVTHDIDEALLVADRVVLLGGSPGHLIAQWKIDINQPRADAIDELTSLRVQILHALRGVQHPSNCHSTPALATAPDSHVAASVRRAA